MRRAVAALVIASACSFPFEHAEADPGEKHFWRGLRVVPETRCSDYRRMDYRYPPAIEDLIVARDGMVSRYTGKTFGGPHLTDIDHVVSLAEAHDSGMCRRGNDDRRAFATDLDNLVLSAPALNRWEKRDKDAGEWLPILPARCWYATTVIRVKKKWRLSVDFRERTALEKALKTCPPGCR